MVDQALKRELARARRRLAPPPVRREPVWPTLAAAAFFAVCALTFAAAAILAPPVQLAPAPVTNLRGTN
ncbi:MAG: hypothetical protein P4L73_10955 [Caulobacteraceae bacterium]|nr:hypothetical protein [Caulobacteraceae bacterium]